MTSGNKRRSGIILGLAAAVLASYAGLAALGDLRGHLGIALAVQALLLAPMLVAWRLARHATTGQKRMILAAALLFRLAACWGEPALSDDVYRFVWDGRVQLEGIHPYRYAPDDPALERLRDENWGRINHPEVKTIYPPVAQMLFAGLAAGGAGPVGFKLGMGLADFGVVLALLALLDRLGLPRDRVVLYAWNPLAVMESAGTGHLESLGVLLVLLSAVWIVARRPSWSTLALGAAVHVKLLPLLLLPGHARRLRGRGVLVLVVVLAVLLLPYGLTGPWVGAGLYDYAERWERNAFVYVGVHELVTWLDPTPALKAAVGAAQRSGPGERVPAEVWNFLYRHVWPRDLARAIVGLALLGWVLVLQFRHRLHAPREAFLVFAGALLLSPTMHPWYVLWVLPFAAAYLSRGWLLFAMLVPLSYLGADGDVPWAIRAIEYVPPVALLIWDAWVERRRLRALC